MRKFKDLKVGEKFEVYGDLFINYDNPVICICEKLDEDTAKEIGGIRFGIHPTDEVFEHEKT